MTDRRTDKPQAAPTWLPAIIVAAALVSYLTSFSGQFILDDDQHIVQNGRIQNVSSWWDLIAKSRRPTVNVTLAVNYALGGLDVWGYHAVNLVIHVLAGLTLFGVIRRTLLGRCLRDRYGPPSSWLALTCALLWVVHPLQTQSVTYIIQRGESLMGLFYLLTLYGLLRSAEASRPLGWYSVAIAACALGMGTKAVMLTAPVAALLFDRVFLTDSFSQLLKRRWGLYLGLCATWVILGTTGVFGGVLSPPAGVPATVGFGVQAVSPTQYALTQPGVILHYLRLCFWPQPLCLDYAWPIARTLGAIVPPLMVIVAILAATAWALRRRPAAGFLGLWFFLILSPTSSFIPIQDIAFEHRMYLPLAAVIVGAVFLGHWVLGRWRPGVWVAASGVLVGVIAAVLGYATLQRNEVYQSQAGMWRDVLATSPESPRGHCGLGVILVDQGRAADAVAHFAEAVRIAPNLAEARYNLGVALYLSGELERAAEQYHEILRLQPKNFRAHHNLGVAQQGLGLIDRAETHFRLALDINPRFTESREKLARLLADRGDSQEAVSQWRELLRFQPGNIDARFSLAECLFGQGQLDEAIDELHEVARLKPDLAEVHNNLGVALWQQGKLNEAVLYFRQALRLNPDFVDARRHLERALAKLGQTEEPEPTPSAPARATDAAREFDRANSLALRNELSAAVEAYRRVVQLDPNHLEAHINLGNLLRRSGRLRQAITHQRKAVELDPDNVVALCSLAAALAADRQMGLALKHVERAVEIDPNDAGARRLLDQILSVGQSSGDSPE